MSDNVCGEHGAIILRYDCAAILSRDNHCCFTIVFLKETKADGKRRKRRSAEQHLPIILRYDDTRMPGLSCDCHRCSYGAMRHSVVCQKETEEGIILYYDSTTTRLYCDDGFHRAIVGRHEISVFTVP